MVKKYRKNVPKIPIFHRNTYEIPESYTEAYSLNKIRDCDEQKALFYLTQFGGFRLKKIPSYFKDKETFFSKWFQIKYEKGYSKYKANPYFFSVFGKVELAPLLRHKYKEPHYKKEFLEENGTNLVEAKGIEQFLKELNEFYSSVRLDLSLPSSGITNENRVEISRFNSIPHFWYKPKAGNRLFQSGPGSSFQMISSNLRPYVKINGEKTNEIDISASSIQFLNIVLEKKFGDVLIPKEKMLDDPYKPFLVILNSPKFRSKQKLEADFTRDELKEILYTWIYSNTKSEENNVNFHLRLMGKKYRFRDIQERLPSFASWLSLLKTSPQNQKENTSTYQLNFLDQLVAEEANSEIPLHQLIFKEESHFTRAVLKKSCLEKGFPVLPIHDSFMTPRNNFKDLSNILLEVSEEFYHYPILCKKKF